MDDEQFPDSGLVVRSDLSIIGWERDTFIEVLLSLEDAAALGARLSHLARVQKAAAQEQEARERKATEQARLRLSVRPESDHG